MVNPWSERPLRQPRSHFQNSLNIVIFYRVPVRLKKSFLLSAISLLITAHLNAQLHVNSILVHKKARTMELIHAGQVLKTYKIALGGEPIGPKTKRGDHRTPEGMYVIDSRNLQSQFHRSLHISYPNAADKERARRLGVPTGGDIYIHGLPNGYGFIGAAHRARDWTDGCIAVTNAEIEEIWRLVDNGTPVEIRP
jgi:murein L,D-transpeptidase YafK